MSPFSWTTASTIALGDGRQLFRDTEGVAASIGLPSGLQAWISPDGLFVFGHALDTEYGPTASLMLSRADGAASDRDAAAVRRTFFADLHGDVRELPFQASERGPSFRWLVGIPKGATLRHVLDALDRYDMHASPKAGEDAGWPPDPQEDERDQRVPRAGTAPSPPKCPDEDEPLSYFSLTTDQVPPSRAPVLPHAPVRLVDGRLLRPIPSPRDQALGVRRWQGDDGMVVVADAQASETGMHVSVSYGEAPRDPSDHDVDIVRRLFYPPGVQVTVQQPMGLGSARVVHLYEVTPDSDLATDELLKEVQRELMTSPEGRAIYEAFASGRIDKEEAQRRHVALLESPRGRAALDRAMRHRGQQSAQNTSNSGARRPAPSGNDGRNGAPTRSLSPRPDWLPAPGSTTGARSRYDADRPQQGWHFSTALVVVVVLAVLALGIGIGFIFFAIANTRG